MERYQNIRSKDRYDVVIIVDEIFSKEYQILEQTCIDDLDAFIGAGKVKVQTLKENQQYPHKNISTFKFKGVYKTDQKLNYVIKIYLSDYFKCIRCLKYTAIHEKTVCPDCISYLSANHKRQCSHFLSQLKRYPSIQVNIVDSTKKQIE